MIHSPQVGDYTFPGGGADAGETHESSLVREISEECGAKVLSIDGELGKVVEFDIPIEENYDVFKMVSFYYIYKVDPNFGEQSLDQYEKDLGFTPIWVDIDKAILTNQMLLDYWTIKKSICLQQPKRDYMCKVKKLLKITLVILIKFLLHVSFIPSRTSQI